MEVTSDQGLWLCSVKCKPYTKPDFQEYGGYAVRAID